MPPRRFKKKSVKRIVEKRVANAIEEYEKSRALTQNNTGGSWISNSGANTVCIQMCHGCSYIRHLRTASLHFQRELKRSPNGKTLFLKMVCKCLEICKCVNDDKVKFAVCSSRVVPSNWWIGNVQNFGLANANQIHWNNWLENCTLNKGYRLSIKDRLKGRRLLLGNLPWCNRCRHTIRPGSCPLGIVTCFGCGKSWALPE
ncbi:hypothetical protein Tco_0474782 [Tanacetum coccineum]